jgi:DNA-binding response OmpR family regulator
MKVLVVESDPESSLELNGILTKNGFEVEQATSVKNAIHKLQSDLKIGLIISDTALPETDGFELLKYLRNNNIHNRTPILMCSSDSDKDSVLKSVQLGARDFLIKPVNPDILMEKIARITRPKKVAPCVMVVDDDEFILDILQKIIRRDGYEVIPVRSALEALKTLEETKVEVIISDIVMPEMDGMELLASVKTKHPGVQVVMITGHSGRFGKESVLDAGADGFISKPFKNIEIIRTLQRLMVNR